MKSSPSASFSVVQPFTASTASSLVTDAAEADRINPDRQNTVAIVFTTREHDTNSYANFIVGIVYHPLCKGSNEKTFGFMSSPYLETVAEETDSIRLSEWGGRAILPSFTANVVFTGVTRLSAPMSL